MRGNLIKTAARALELKAVVPAPRARSYIDTPKVYSRSHFRALGTASP